MAAANQPELFAARGAVEGAPGHQRDVVLRLLRIATEADTTSDIGFEIAHEFGTHIELRGR